MSPRRRLVKSFEQTSDTYAKHTAAENQMYTYTNNLVELAEQPIAAETYMIAGWRQWADAGSTSSKLPRYLIDQTRAKRIGEIRSQGFYLFQIPGTHHWLRPKVKVENGYTKKLQARRNEFFYAGDDQKGLVIFCGTEPHLNIDRYVRAFLDAAKALAVRRVVAVGGVHRAVPYDRERQISCVYSLPAIKEELAKYAVKLSSQEGGASIGTYLAHRAEERGIQFLALFASTPFYNFGKSSAGFTGIQLESDYQAWYDVMKRLNRMLDLDLDLSDLEIKSRQLVAIVRAQIDELDKKAPQFKIKKRIAKMTRDFVETSFPPLGEVWARELRHLLDDGQTS
jgi:proteasome assembly chaperone (PAC2) family protein